MEIFWVFIFVMIFGFVLIIASIKSDNDEKQKAFLKWRNDLTSQYGEPTLEIQPFDINDKLYSVFVFDTTRKILINQTVFDYSAIWDFSTNE